jgi:dCTP deaminase
MILTGSEIKRAVYDGDIIIEPFSHAQVGPNSYDFRLGNRCKTYVGEQLDCAIENRTRAVPFGEQGLLLRPDKVYLFNTHEKMGSQRFVPIIRGRSSAGRLGIFINITADLIDIGSINQWTLQLHVVEPVTVYPGMLIGQVTFWVPQGEIVLYTGKYGSLLSPVASLSHRDFTNGTHRNACH